MVPHRPPQDIEVGTTPDHPSSTYPCSNPLEKIASTSALQRLWMADWRKAALDPSTRAHAAYWLQVASAAEAMPTIVGTPPTC
jgi:hypothetical protein